MYDKQTIQSLFAAYKSFGGNSFIPELIDEVMSLPLTKPKIKRKTRKAEKEDV
jgi:hypothetical protein